MIIPQKESEQANPPGNQPGGLPISGHTTKRYISLATVIGVGTFIVLEALLLAAVVVFEFQVDNYFKIAFLLGIASVIVGGVALVRFTFVFGVSRPSWMEDLQNPEPDIIEKIIDVENVIDLPRGQVIELAVLELVILQYIVRQDDEPTITRDTAMSITGMSQPVYTAATMVLAKLGYRTPNNKWVDADALEILAAAHRSAFVDEAGKFARVNGQRVGFPRAQSKNK